MDPKKYCLSRRTFFLSPFPKMKKMPPLPPRGSCLNWSFFFVAPLDDEVMRRVKHRFHPEKPMRNRRPSGKMKPSIIPYFSGPSGEMPLKISIRLSINFDNLAFFFLNMESCCFLTWLLVEAHHPPKSPKSSTKW